MRYVYRNEQGDTREIQASMKNPPPERVLFRDADQWEPAPDDVQAWTRVYGNVVIDSQKWASKAYGVGRIDVPKGLPGCEVDKHGRSIIRNKAHEKDIMRQYGYVRYED